ncbi:unnamed protein product [Effrenium voratum]|nr:unnamed protein product [Effrenium voratum]
MVSPWRPPELGPSWQSMLLRGLPVQCQRRDKRDQCRSTDNSPRLHVCADSACDEYSVGSGYCPVYAPLNVYCQHRNGSQAVAFTRAINCQASAGNASHLFFCPVQVPIAVAIMHKAGSHAVGAWLLGLHPRGRLLGRRWFAARGPSGFERFQRWLFGRQGLGAGASLGERGQRSLFRRMQMEMAQHSLISKCILCCAFATRRLPVIFVRNPYRRVESYFRHRFLGNSGKAPLTTWEAFPGFLRLLADHRRDSVWRAEALPPLDEHDLMHTLSLDELLEDVRWPQAAREALARIFPVRLEAPEDFLELQSALCADHGYCQPLPALPDIFPLSPLIASLEPTTAWTQEARDLMAVLFSSDFARLGYCLDPGATTPCRPRRNQKTELAASSFRLGQVGSRTPARNDGMSHKCAS